MEIHKRKKKIKVTFEDEIISLLNSESTVIELFVIFSNFQDKFFDIYFQLNH